MQDPSKGDGLGGHFNGLFGGLLARLQVLSSILQSYTLPLEEEEQAAQQAGKEGSGLDL